VGVGLQPASPALLVLAQLQFGVGGPVGLLAGHRHHSAVGADPLAPSQQAKHAPALVRLGRLLAGELLEDLIGRNPVDAGPRQLPSPIPGGLVQQSAQPVALGPQLGGG